jgi:hypothetical protein
MILFGACLPTSLALHHGVGPGPPLQYWQPHLHEKNMLTNKKITSPRVAMILFGACIPTVLHQISRGCVCRNLTTDLSGTAVSFPL